MEKSKFELLMEKKKELESQIKSEKKRFSKLERDKDTRKKILIGAFVISREKLFDQVIKSKDFDTYITKKNDRLIFGFPISEGEKIDMVKAESPKTGEDKEAVKKRGTFEIRPDDPDL